MQFYYEGCGACRNLSGNLFDYLDAYKEGEKKTKVYIFDMKSSKTEEGTLNRNKFKTRPSSPTENKDLLISEMIRKKVETLDETYFFGVPSLYIIESNHLKDLKIGTQVIADYYALIK